MSMSTEQQQTAVTKKHSGGSRGRAKSKKIAQDPYDSVYGRVPWEMFRGRPWTYAGKLDESRVGNYVLLLGKVMRVRPLGKTRTIVVLLSRSRTVRCMVVASPDEGVTTRMVHFAATLRRGTYIDIEGVVSSPGIEADLLGTTQQVEIQVRKLHTIATNKDGSPVDAVTTVEDDSLVDGVPNDGVAPMEGGSSVDGVAAMEDGSLVDGVATMEDGSPVDGVNIDGGVAAMADGNPVDGVAMMGHGSLVDGVATREDDDGSQVEGGVSQSSSISITTRPSIMLQENLVGREAEIQARNLHTIATLQDGSPVDGASQSSSISITTRPLIMLEGNLVLFIED